MVHPGKTPGCLGDPPDPWKLSSVRVSHVQYKDKTPVTIYEDSYAFGKTRLMQLWTGSVLRIMVPMSSAEVLACRVARAFREKKDHIRSTLLILHHGGA